MEETTPSHTTTSAALLSVEALALKDKGLERAIAHKDKLLRYAEENSKLFFC
jgi:hypothetical protein